MNKPKPNSKQSLNIKARSPSEQNKIGDFKTLAVQDSINQVDLFFEALELLFKVHHWPPGNPQLQLMVFQETKIPTVFCKCGKPAIKVGVNFKNNSGLRVCAKCFSDVPMRFDNKLWQWRNIS